jgi:hypothetical protein
MGSMLQTTRRPHDVLSYRFRYRMIRSLGWDRITQVALEESFAWTVCVELT